ncbi:Translation initiation factor IF-2 [Colletotrichum siamense]|nr:Translation initiation factor IF-2 [Colletotrichum siamense]
MLRCRIWKDRSSAYVCAFCRHPALATQRDIGRRSYSDTPKPTPNAGGFPGGWGSSSGIPRPSGPTVSSGWGKPSFGGGSPPANTNGSATSNPDAQQTNNESADDGLLPHERAAKLRIKKSQPTPPLTSPPQPLKTVASFGESSSPREGTRSGLGTGLNKARVPSKGFSERPPSGLGGSGGLGGRGLGLGNERKPGPLHRSRDQPDRKRGDANGSQLADWRHKELGRNSFGADKKSHSTPVPHHRHAASKGLGRPLPERPQQSQAKVEDEASDKPAEWGLLARRVNPPPSVEESSPTPPPPTSGWNDEAPKKTSPATNPITKDTFFAKFQEHMESRPKQPARRSLEIEPDGVVEEYVAVDVAENRENRLDESYEIERDARKRDKSGARRGDAFNSSRGKKSYAQKRWEDQNEEWDETTAREIAERRRQKAEEKARRKAEAEAAAASQTIFLPEFISIGNLGSALKMKPKYFLRALTEMGFEDITEESIMTGETASLVAMEFGFEATVDTGGDRDLRPRPPPEDMSTLPPRPPVVTIMGHVDHGKTTLLDYLRKSSVAAQEHGGITQHIGAFMVKMSSGKLITFLDTPGHAAFLTMRQRGANVTDIVVLVVAADDSVKPQTLEALKHARAAKVPIIVAINKIDKEDARPDQVKADLSRHGVEIEDFGGDVQVVCVSGKTGKGMDELEENIGALAEIQDMRAEQDGMAEAWVLEASVKPHGKSANILVKRGTLRPGDHIVAGTTWARIRMLRNEAGQELSEAPPGTPVEVLGWREQLPAAGDEVLQAPTEDRARTAISYREEMREREASSKQLAEQEQRERDAKAAAEAQAAGEVGEEDAEGSTTQVINFAVRGDVVGSVEAVCATINEIGNNEVKARILWSAAGQVSETDIEHAAASNSTVVNFNSTIPGHIKAMAEEKGVKLIDHSVIYHLADDVKQVMSERLAPKITQKVTGEADILQVFPINVKGRVFKNIAGCRVRNGMITRSNSVRIIRKGEKVFDGKVETLKHGKKDMSEIRKGSECGISFDGFTDFQIGDQIQCYDEVKEKRSL